MRSKKFRRLVASGKRGVAPWVWVLGGAGGLFVAFVLFVGSGAWRHVPGIGLRGTYTVESTEQWLGRSEGYKESGIWNGHTVQITGDTFEGLGVTSRYELLSDGRVQIGGAICRYDTDPAGLVLVTPDWRYRLRRR